MRVVASTTSDPEGIDFNLLGWIYAFSRHPARRETSRSAGYAALAVNRALSPLERTGDRGSAITLVMRKDG